MDLNVRRRVLVTGGASGLGREIALCFAAQGHDVAIADLNEARGSATLEALRELGVQAAYFHCDVRAPDGPADTVDKTLAALGGLDVMINNAGVAGGGDSEEEWHRIMGINFFGVWRGCMAVKARFLQQGHGHIVNIASMAGLLNPPGMAAYNVSKAAVVSLSETLLPELRVQDCGLTLVCPSFFQTNLAESIPDQDPQRLANLSKLMATSELSANQIAQAIYQAVANDTFLLLPHEKARDAWEFKQASYDEHLALQEKLAEKLRDASASHRLA